MPILLHVDDLKPGLCLAQAVYQGEQRLICGGQELEQWQIDSLRRRFPNMVVRVLDPILDKMTEFQDSSQDEEVSATITSRMSHMMTSVQTKLGARTALDGSDLAGLQTAIVEVMRYLGEHPVTAAVLTHSRGRTGYLQEHAANVMYLSLLVGNAVRDYIYHERVRTSCAKTLAVRFGINLCPLTLGCLFHDLGMLELEDLFEKGGALTEEEQARLRRHPIVGAEMLPEETDAVTKMIVRTHHENLNGTGYPQGIGGGKLHVFSRIIRLADAFDAGTSQRVYRDAKSPARVLWELVAGANRTFYDPLIARILTAMVQPFPIGAKVRLSCGRYGVVVRHNRKYPFRPIVIIAFDENGDRLKKKQLEPPINLASCDTVRIVEHAGEDLSFLNTGVELPPTPDALQWGELLQPDAAPIEPTEKSDLFSFVYP
jgi:HD-GYP domain-containing protein (c-di-GMP phosphodiesterase class II)